MCIHQYIRNTQTKRGESKTCYPEGCQVRKLLNYYAWYLLETFITLWSLYKIFKIFCKSVHRTHRNVCDLAFSICFSRPTNGQSMSSGLGWGRGVKTRNLSGIESKTLSSKRSCAATRRLTQWWRRVLAASTTTTTSWASTFSSTPTTGGARSSPQSPNRPTPTRAHLLEVNTIPSMFINKSSEEIDLRLKGPVLAESFNIAGHHISTSG